MREKLIELLDNFNRDLSPYAGDNKYFMVDDNCELADHLIANDVVIVVHAEWLDGSGMSRDGSVVYQSIDCSHCEEVFKIESETREYWKARFKVCPFCGAKMEDDSNV